MRLARTLPWLQWAFTCWGILHCFCTIFGFIWWCIRFLALDDLVAGSTLWVCFLLPNKLGHYVISLLSCHFRENFAKWRDFNILGWIETSQASPLRNNEVPGEHTGCYSDLVGNIEVEDTQNKQNFNNPQLALSWQEYATKTKHHHVGYFWTIVFIY